MVVAALFMAAALAVPMTFTHNHNLTEDDAKAFSAIIEPVRRSTGHSRPPIVFIYNYYRMAESLRRQGLRAYSVTTQMHGGHIRASLSSGLPLLPASMAAVVILQKATYFELFEALNAVCMNGALLIEWNNLPYLSEVVLVGMGFRKTYMSWHDIDIWRRVTVIETLPGDGFEAFNKKHVVHPRWQFHKPVSDKRIGASA